MAPLETLCQEKKAPLCLTLLTPEFSCLTNGYYTIDQTLYVSVFEL